MPISQVFIDGSTLQEIEIPFINVSFVSISHTFLHRPNVTICDSSGNLIQGDVVFSGQSVTVTFCRSISGTIFLS